MEIIAGTDPFTLFQRWYDEAVKTEINDPDAIAIASVDRGGMHRCEWFYCGDGRLTGFYSSLIMKAGNQVNCWLPARLLFAFTGKASDDRCGWLAQY